MTTIYNSSNSEKEDNDNKRLGENKAYNFTKRFMDIVLTLIASPLIIIIVIVASISIKLDDGGKIFYTQKRVGKNFVEFDILKLRSMIENAEDKTGAVWASKEDSRITKSGKFLRKYRIDELPQFINVLKGEMSIVGPRPERLDLTKEFILQYPSFENRLRVKPGITGLAQVNGGYDISPLEKSNIDNMYIEKLSLSQDLKILFKTVRIVVTGDGSR